MIEIRAAGNAALKAASGQLKEMKTQIGIMENSPSNEEAYVNADFKFHRLIVEATGNKLLLAIVDAYEELLRELIKKSSDTEISLEREHGYHRNIYEAIEKQDADKARSCMEIHLNATEELKERFL